MPEGNPNHDEKGRFASSPGRRAEVVEAAQKLTDLHLDKIAGGGWKVTLEKTEHPNSSAWGYMDWANKKIFLDPRFVDANPNDEIKDTVLHEIGHALAHDEIGDQAYKRRRAGDAGPHKEGDEYNRVVAVEDRGKDIENLRGKDYQAAAHSEPWIRATKAIGGTAETHAAQHNYWNADDHRMHNLAVTATDKALEAKGMKMDFAGHREHEKEWEEEYQRQFEPLQAAALKAKAEAKEAKEGPSEVPQEEAKKALPALQEKAKASGNAKAQEAVRDYEREVSSAWQDTQGKPVQHKVKIFKEWLRTWCKNQNKYHRAKLNIHELLAIFK